MTASLPPHYPFTAIVGQAQLKRALVLNAVNPAIGGVLIQGEKGTAKSTAVRGLAALLPEIAVVAGCPYQCDPAAPAALCPHCRDATMRPVLLRPARIVTLPIGATEDRLLGTLDLERAIKEGERRVEPGLLAAAHRGILAIDEVNLLADHLVDALLDAAALGVNTVEREGISVSHPASFILVGTMNPEEGEVRPQLLDRFGLSVPITSPREPAERVEIIRRRLAFEADPAAFASAWAVAEATERARIERAIALLPRVTLLDPLLDLIARLCLAAGVDGVRADLVIARAARTLAALDGRLVATIDDIRQAAELALVHRRQHPFDEPPAPSPDLDRLIDNWQPEPPATRPPTRPEGPPPPAAPPPSSGADDTAPETTAEEQSNQADTPPGGPPPERVAAIAQVATPMLPRPTARARVTTPLARGRERDTANPTGRLVTARQPWRPSAALALVPTLRAAAPHQIVRQQSAPISSLALLVAPTDLHGQVRQGRARRLILFLIDASGSMGARQRMAAAKGAVLRLLVQAYHHRDRVGLIICRGPRASLLLPPTPSGSVARQRLATLPNGGRTPLAHGLRLTGEVIARARRVDPGLRPLLVVLSDGRANVALHGGDALADARAVARDLARRTIPALVIDAEDGPVRLGLAHDLAAALGATYQRLPTLTDAALANAVGRALHTGSSDGK